MAAEFKKNDPAKARQYFADKAAFTTGPVEVSQQLKPGGNNIAIIDVREPEDFAKGHVPGALNLPRQKWSNAEVLRKDGVNIIYCYSQQCHLAAHAAVEFAGKGYSVMEMEGGFEAWKENDLDVESGASTEKRWKSQEAMSA